MAPSHHGPNNSKAITSRTHALHQRLTQALTLGVRVGGDKEGKWQCTDMEIQRHVVRSIAAFIGSVSGDTRQHPLLKASVADIVGALHWILQSNNGAILTMATDVTFKLVSILPKSVLQLYELDLVDPLCSLLSFHQAEVATLCAAALKLILSKLSAKSRNEVWDILNKKESVSHVISNLRSFPGCTKPLEYFQEMALLLSMILRRSPASRCFVWSNSELMNGLNDMLKLGIREKVAVLKLYSSLALCGNGAKTLLENGEVLLQQMVLCMDKSNPYSVRVEAFKLAQCLVRNEHLCLRMLSLCPKSIIKALISGMSEWSSHSKKDTNDQMSLLEEACRLALITRWAGEHHISLWEQHIDKILLDLLLENFHNQPYKCSISLDKQIATAKEALNANYLLDLRNYIWDILGWLAIHCEENFHPGCELYTNILITSACFTFVDAIRQWRKIYADDIAGVFRSESATRAVLMMIYSPCKYIASKTTSILSEIIDPDGMEHLKIFLLCLNDRPSSNDSDMVGKLKSIIYFMGFMCYLNLPQYRSWIIRKNGLKTVLALMKWRLSNNFHLDRSSFAPHLHDKFDDRICCWVSVEDWEGKDILLFYSLWGLAELIQESLCLANNLDIISGAHIEAQLVSTLQDICYRCCTPGLQWYAAYILSYFGYYGFPSKQGKRIGKILSEKDYADIQLILPNGECLSVHGVVLATQCSSLLPPEGLLPSEVTSDDSSATGSMEICRGFQKDIRLSSHVDHNALVMLLEFIYSGYLQVGDELAKKFRSLAKRCKLVSLVQMLCRKRPKWGTAFPSVDLSVALGPSGRCFSDVILEAKEAELWDWTCDVCSRPVPHIHAHKVVLLSSSDYFRALFTSGMQESRSQTLKVPINWKAMVILVDYLYTSKLRKPPTGCLWNNMNTEEKLQELQPYVELFWLSEYWLMEDLPEACSDVILSCLCSARELSIKILKIAAKFSMWKVADVAATYAAPFYRQLCESGELDELDELLAETVRAASVRLSQQGGNDFWRFDVH